MEATPHVAPEASSLASSSEAVESLRSTGRWQCFETPLATPLASSLASPLEATESLRSTGEEELKAAAETEARVPGVNGTATQLEAVQSSLRYMEFELAAERSRSETLKSEAEAARRSADSLASVEIQSLQRRVMEMEAQLQTVKESSEADPRETGRSEAALEAALEAERERRRRLSEEAQRTEAELMEERLRRAELSEEASSGAGRGEPPEVEALRAELAKRDRRLLVLAAERRRSADQSERAAAALRARLSELEAAIQATPTPSTSSQASSPPSQPRSEVDAGWTRSDVDSAVPGSGPIRRGDDFSALEQDLMGNSPRGVKDVPTSRPEAASSAT